VQVEKGKFRIDVMLGDQTRIFRLSNNRSHLSYSSPRNNLQDDDDKKEKKSRKKMSIDVTCINKLSIVRSLRADSL